MYDLIVIPTYNERTNIVTMVKELFSLYPEIRILVVDDSSPDGTGEVVRDLMKEYPQLSLRVRSKKDGLGAAYKDALSYVRTDKNLRSVITMDADGSHHPRYVGNLLSLISAYDLVVGSRYVRGGGVENWEFWRLALSRYGNLYPWLFAGIGVRDMTAGFVCIKRELLDRVNFDKINASGYAYQLEFKFHCVHDLGARAKESPIIFYNRREGESKLSNHIIREGLISPLRLLARRIRGALTFLS